MKSARWWLLLALCLSAEVGSSRVGMAETTLRDRAAQGGDVPGYPVAWGDNSLGQLGIGRDWVSTPSPTPLHDLTHVLAVTASIHFSAALRADGTVWAWGDCCGPDDPPGSFGHPSPRRVQGLSDVVAIASYLAVKRDGTVWRYGPEAPRRVLGVNDVVKVASGDEGNNSLALCRDGTVWELNGDHPLQVPGLNRITAIAAGWSHNLALAADGTVWVWKSGGVSRAAPPPEQVKGPRGQGVLTNVVGIAANWAYSLAVRRDGTVWFWTWGIVRARDVPVRMPGLSDTVAVATETGHSVALKRDGTVWEWGFKAGGKPGEQAVPVQVRGLHAVVAVAAGLQYSLAISRVPVAFRSPPLCAASAPGSGGNGFPRTVHLRSFPTALAVSQRTGRVFVGSGQAEGCLGGLILLDATTGWPLRSVDVAGRPIGIRVADSAGRALIGNQEGNVVLVDTRTGRPLHTTRLAGRVSALAVDSSTGRAFVLTSERPSRSQYRLYMLSLTTGAVLRTTPVGPGGTMEVDERTRHLFVLEDGALLMLDSRDGRVLRRIPVERGPIGIEGQTARIFVVGTRSCQIEPQGTYSSVVVQVLDSRTGALLRTIDQACRYVPQQPQLVVDQPLGLVLILQWTGAPQSVLDALVLDGRTGAVRRPFTKLGGGAPWSGPVTTIPGPDVVAVDWRSGAIYFARYRGSLVQLDVRRWTIRWRGRLVGTPSAIAVADRARRIFVALTIVGSPLFGSVTVLRASP